MFMDAPYTGGFIAVSDILLLPRGRGFSEGDVRRVVVSSDKQRFALREEAGQLLIRANQGHSIEVGLHTHTHTHTHTFPFQVSDLELRPILCDEVPCVVHGTSLKAWNEIKHQVCM